MRKPSDVVAVVPTFVLAEVRPFLAVSPFARFTTACMDLGADILPFPSVTGVHAYDPAGFLLRLASHSLAASSINSDAVVSPSIAAVLMALMVSGPIVTRN